MRYPLSSLSAVIGATKKADGKYVSLCHYVLMSLFTSAVLVAVCNEAQAQTVKSSELNYYASPKVLPPITGQGNRSKGGYVISGMRISSSKSDLPSPKMLKKPEYLPSITLRDSQYTSPVRKTAAGSPPHYPTPPVFKKNNPPGRTASVNTELSGSYGETRVLPPVITSPPPVTITPVQQPDVIQEKIVPPKSIRRQQPIEPEPIPFAPQPVTSPAIVAQTLTITPAALPSTASSSPAVILEPVMPEKSTDFIPTELTSGTSTVVTSEKKLEEPVPLAPQTVENMIEKSAVVTAVSPEPLTSPSPPELSERSRFVLDHTPSGIDSPKHVVMRTPKPVVIKRESAKTATLPVLDVRSHEEMGLKIEVRKADPNVNQYLEQGYESLIAGRYQIAAGFYQEILNAEPRNETALFGLATTYQKAGQSEEARDLYAKLLSFNPGHREALNNFMALVSDEAPQEAIGELERLEMQNPDFSPVPAQLGIVYSKQGDYKQAATKLTRALTLSPDNLSYKYNLAIALDKLGDAKNAAELYVELVEAYKAGATVPGDLDAIRNRIIYLSQKS